MISRPLELAADILELASVLSKAEPCNEFEQFIRAMHRPAAILVLALMRVFASHLRKQSAKDLAAWYLVHPASQEADADQLSIIRIRTEKAESESYGVGDPLADAVETCINKLGRAHPYTIQLRISCASRLCQSRDPAAREWLVDLQEDLRTEAVEVAARIVTHPLDEPIDIGNHRSWVAERLLDMDDCTPPTHGDSSCSSPAGENRGDSSASTPNVIIGPATTNDITVTTEQDNFNESGDHPASTGATNLGTSNLIQAPPAPAPKPVALRDANFEEGEWLGKGIEAVVHKVYNGRKHYARKTVSRTLRSSLGLRGL